MNKKKILLLTTLLIFTLSLFACNKDTSNNEKGDSKESTVKTYKFLKVNETEIEAQEVILLNYFLEEDKKELERLEIPEDEYPGGFYYKELDNKDMLKADENTKITIIDNAEKYSKDIGEDRKYTFESFKDFASLFKTNEDLANRIYIVETKDGKVIKAEEKLTN